MADVTCKAVQTFVDVVVSRGVDPALLTEGMGYSREFLRDKNNRVTWADFVEIGRRLRTLCNLSDQDLEEVGRGAFKSGALRLVMSLARVLGDPARFYQWMQRGNKMLFSNMRSNVVVQSPERLTIEIELREQDEQSMEYLLISKGAIASMPTLLGYPEASVQLKTSGRQARFEVTMRSKRRSFVRRTIESVSGRYETAEELLATNEALTRRLEQLSEANQQIQAQAGLLDQQAGRLQLALEISKLIHGTLDLQATLDTIVATLMAHTGATAVRLRIHGVDGPAGDVSEAATGQIDAPSAYLLSLPVAIHGTDVGTLSLASSSALAERELAASLEYVLPVLAMAIDNALAYRRLADYQQGLERLVVVRTAELRTAHDALSATVDQLREAQGTRERIFANISHEIRTPLSLILLAVADVESRAGAALDEVARDDLKSVVDSARKLLRLVDELLLLAAGEEIALKVAPQPTDLAGLLAALVTTWRPAAAASGVTLHAHLPTVLKVMVDPVAIERVLTNLLSNAVKFTPRGGRISLDVTRDDAGIRIAVRDTGIGIDDDLALRLFGRFERARGGTTRGGSGIGLSLVKELVEAHGGKVTVERIASGGTEFLVVIPAIDAGAEVGVEAMPRLRPSDYGVTSAAVVSGQVLSPPLTSGVTILVAEDDPRLAAMTSRLLAEKYNVVVALDGLEALALVRQHQPHLLVTDVDMPGMNGIELTQRFREATNDTLAPVVILSALADPGHRLAGLGAGAVDYVVKPFDPRELMARVRSQLSMRDLALRLHRAEQLSALGTLSSGLAHELRNPANGIVNAIGPLKALLPAELRDLEHPVGQLIDVMSGCAEQISFLSRQLLSFRRGGELELRLVALNDVVQRAVTLARPALRGITLRESIDVPAPVKLAPPLMVQVLTNLIENAAHAAGQGGWVELVGSSSNSHVTLEISDSGPGVPLELRDRVFEPFFTTKPPGVGTGLGLPLARDIIHRHGGVLEIREREQRAVFVVELPRPPEA